MASEIAEFHINWTESGHYSAIPFISFGIVILKVIDKDTDHAKSRGRLINHNSPPAVSRISSLAACS